MDTSYFYSLAFVNNAVMNMEIQISLQDSDFILIRNTLKVVNVDLTCYLFWSIFPLMLLFLCNSP